MSESLLELAISLIVGLFALVSVGWIVASGQIAYMDGIALALIALTIGVFFLFNIYLAYRAGDIQALLKSRQKKGPGDPSQGA